MNICEQCGKPIRDRMNEFVLGDENENIYLHEECADDFEEEYYNED